MTVIISPSRQVYQTGPLRPVREGSKWSSNHLCNVCHIEAGSVNTAPNDSDCLPIHSELYGRTGGRQRPGTEALHHVRMNFRYAADVTDMNNAGVGKPRASSAAFRNAARSHAFECAHAQSMPVASLEHELADRLERGR